MHKNFKFMRVIILTLIFCVSILFSACGSDDEYSSDPYSDDSYYDDSYSDDSYYDGGGYDDGYDDWDTDDNGMADWNDVDTDNDGDVSGDEMDSYLNDWDSEMSDY